MFFEGWLKLTEKTKEQIINEFNRIFGAPKYYSIESHFEDSIYVKYYGELSEYDFDIINNYGYILNNIKAGFNQDIQMPYLRIVFGY